MIDALGAGASQHAWLPRRESTSRPRSSRCRPCAARLARLACWPRLSASRLAWPRPPPTAARLARRRRRRPRRSPAAASRVALAVIRAQRLGTCCLERAYCVKLLGLGPARLLHLYCFAGSFPCAGGRGQLSSAGTADLVERLAWVSRMTSAALLLALRGALQCGTSPSACLARAVVASIRAEARTRRQARAGVCM